MTSDDLVDFHACNTNPFVRSFLWDDQEIPLSTSQEILEEVERRFSDSKWGLWKISKIGENTYLGYVGLLAFFEEKQPQLLYALRPEHAGRGFATEAAAKIIEYAFVELGFSYLLASMDEENRKSVAVCTRLGMSFVEQLERDGKPTLFYKAATDSPQ